MTALPPLPDVLDAVARAGAWPVAGAILLNQLDELAIDASFLARGLHRRARRAVSREALLAEPMKRIAILVPAWKESDVIGQMLARNVAGIDYDRDRYDFFCGTYRNDPETQACVDAVARRERSVKKVVVPHDGPTSKADCLNWIWRGILDEEARRGIRYDVLVLHDAEDVVHPLSLRLYSRLVPRHEFVQLPVFSLDRRPGQWVAGTYIDEFAEHHQKELTVRAAMGGLVPSAGVGTAFDRDAFEEIALANRRHPFDEDSLTEDYAIGLDFRLAGKRVHFACVSVEREAAGGGGRREEEVIATREYFPSGLGASIRQRSRWVLGITLQTWAKVGWKGGAAVRYCLWRDRKALFANAVVLLAYALLAYAALRAGLAALDGSGWTAERVIPRGSALAWIVAANTAFVAWRGAMKAWLVGRLYGPMQAALSLPRVVVANVVGVAATARAVRSWLRHRLLGEPLRWSKTAHEFPEGEPLPALAPAAAALAPVLALATDGEDRRAPAALAPPPLDRAPARDRVARA